MKKAADGLADPKAKKPKRRMYYEASAQIGAVAWCRTHSDLHPALAWIYHAPNGGKRNPHEAAQLQKMGLIPGTPDLFLPWGNDRWNGLFLEMKSYNPVTKKRGRLSEAQRDFFEYAGGAGYRCEVAYSSDEAVALICEYLGIEHGNDGGDAA